MIEYSDNYSDPLGSLCQFKKDEVPANNAVLTSKSFKYKTALVGKTAEAADRNSFVKHTKILVQLKYLRNFWRSIKMLLINFKVHLELNLIEDCILSSAGDCKL